MPILNDLMLEYVQALKRFNKATHFMDDPGIPDVDKEKWVPELRSIIEKLNGLILQVEDAGLKMTDKQILEGFEVK